MKTGNVIHMSVECSDRFGMTIVGPDGADVLEYYGYVPDFFPGQHFGDYVMLEIDADTGHILNWRAPTKRDLVDCIRDE